MAKIMKPAPAKPAALLKTPVAATAGSPKTSVRSKGNAKAAIEAAAAAVVPRTVRAEVPAVSAVVPQAVKVQAPALSAMVPQARKVEVPQAVKAEVPQAVKAEVPQARKVEVPAVSAVALTASVEAAATPVAAERSAPEPVTALLETGAVQAKKAYARAQATGESFRQAVAESATVTSRGVLEVNDRVLEAMRAQSDATFAVWRAALSAGSLAEAIEVQTGAARKVYESAAANWQQVAQTAGRVLQASVWPMQAVLAPRER